MVHFFVLMVAPTPMCSYNECMTDNCYRTVQVALRIHQRENIKLLHMAMELKECQGIDYWNLMIKETDEAIAEIDQQWNNKLAASLTES